MREKLWMRKFHGADLKDHHRRLRESRSLVDSSKPREAQRSYRLAREREREEEKVSKHNHQMLDRLARVVQKKNIDNEPFKIKAMSRTMAKKREMKVIQKENWHMLSRLENAEKTYSAEKMRKEEAWRQKVLRRMCDQSFEKPARPTSARPLSSRAENVENLSPQVKIKKRAWQGTAIALVEQDRMHLDSEIKPLPASPVFLSKQNSKSTRPNSHQSLWRNGCRRRPHTASGLRESSSHSQSSLPASVVSDTSDLRMREMKKLFKCKNPTGAYVSQKV